MYQLTILIYWPDNPQYSLQDTGWIHFCTCFCFSNSGCDLWLAVCFLIGCVEWMKLLWPPPTFTLIGKKVRHIYLLWRSRSCVPNVRRKRLCSSFWGCALMDTVLKSVETKGRSFHMFDWWKEEYTAICRTVRFNWFNWYINQPEFSAISHQGQVLIDEANLRHTCLFLKLFWF